MEIRVQPPVSSAATTRQSGVPMVHSSLGDRFEPGGSQQLSVVPRPAARPRISLGDIPDASGVAGDPNLRYVDLNKRITAGYGQFAALFQGIVDPAFAATGSSAAVPVWYAIAPTPSRTAGQGELAASAALKVIHAIFGGLQALSPVPDVESILEAQGFETQEIRTAVQVLRAMWQAESEVSSRANVEVLLDPRILAVSAVRMLELVATAPGSSVEDRFVAVANTLQNCLEDGNRRIYGDVGAAGQQYLTFKVGAGGPVSPDQVLDGFSLTNPPNPPQAHEIYDFATASITGSDPLPIDFETRFPPPQYDSKNMLVAAFALYEKAGQTADAALRDRTISFANNLLAYREQHDAVQPAFTPGAVLPGETDRLQLMQIMSPIVDLNIRAGEWTYARYARQNLPDRDGHFWLPRVLDYNWGTFDDRWDALIDAFAFAYRDPQAMWPPPNPDPAAPP